MRQQHPVGRVSRANARNHDKARLVMRGVTRRRTVGLRCATRLV